MATLNRRVGRIVTGRSYRMGERFANGSKRWWEFRDHGTMTYVNPLGRRWWRWLWVRTSDPVYDRLHYWGFLDVPPGGWYDSAPLCWPWSQRHRHPDRMTDAEYIASAKPSGR